MALDATPGGPTSNAYCDALTATTLLAERLHTEAWTSADPADQDAALIWATRLLEEQVRWEGSPATTTQALAWPRTGVLDPQGRPVDPAVVPVTIQRATATYALYLLQDTSQTSGGVAAGTVKRRVLGDTSIEYFQPGSGQQLTQFAATSVPREVAQMLYGCGTLVGGLFMQVLRT